MNSTIAYREQPKATRPDESIGVVRESDVPAALDELCKSIEELDAVLQLLWTRLEPVARLEPEELRPKPEQAPHGHCQLSMGIRHQVEKVQGTTRSVYRLLELLEV